MATTLKQIFSTEELQSICDAMREIEIFSLNAENRVSLDSFDGIIKAICEVSALNEATAKYPSLRHSLQTLHNFYQANNLIIDADDENHREAILGARSATLDIAMSSIRKNLEQQRDNIAIKFLRGIINTFEEVRGIFSNQQEAKEKLRLIMNDTTTVAYRALNYAKQHPGESFGQLFTAGLAAYLTMGTSLLSAATTTLAFGWTSQSQSIRTDIGNTIQQIYTQETTKIQHR